ncbi:MAG: hypothetical protein ACRYFZ_06900 [Janthinobacterium lividum]
MPSFWQRFFGQSLSSNSISIPVEFSTYAAHAIQLLTNSNGQLTDKQTVDLFLANKIPHKEAIELLLSLPIAFCQNLLPQIDWPNYYWEYISEKKRVKHLYTEKNAILSFRKP